MTGLIGKFESNIYAVIGVFVIAVLSRFLFIAADSPAPIPEDAAFRTDQGWYSQGAMYKLLEGEWFIPNDRNPVFHTALYNFIQYVFFSIFGLHFWTAKLQSILFSVLSILVFYLYLRKKSTPRICFIFLLVSVINYFYFSYSRVALVEPTVAFFSICFFILWIESSRRSGLGFLCGIMIFLAIISKTHGIFLLGFMLLSVLYDVFVNKVQIRRSMRKILIPITTFCLMFAGWYCIWIKPNLDVLAQFDVYTTRVPTSISQLGLFLFDFARECYQFLLFAFIRTPFVFGFILLSVLWLIATLKRKAAVQKQDVLLVQSILFVIAGIAFILVNRYVRPRFFILYYIPALYILAYFLGSNELKWTQSKKVIPFIYLGFILFTLYRMINKTVNSPDWIVLISLAFLILPFLYVYMNLSKRLVPLILTSFLILQFLPYNSWLSGLTYNTINAGRQIEEVLENNNDDEEYIFGSIAPTLALEGGFRALSPFEWDKNNTAFCIENIQPKYYLLSNDDAYTILDASNWYAELEAIKDIVYGVRSRYSNAEIPLLTLYVKR